MPQKKPDDPSITSAAYDVMQPRWQRIDAVLGGTETMRAAGTAYLPQHSEEADEVYDERLKTSTLLNETEIILNGWVGKPFSKPVQLSETTPEQIKEWADDIDLQGNNLDVFAREWFRSGVAKGFSHVLVEFS